MPDLRGEPVQDLAEQPRFTGTGRGTGAETVLRSGAAGASAGAFPQPSRMEGTGLVPARFGRLGVLAAQAAQVAAAGAADAESHRRLRPAVVTALVEAGFARHFVPAEHGGTEGGFGELLEATALVAEGCASAAWCAVLWAAHGRLAARLPSPGRRAVWADGPDTRIAAGLVPPAGSAEPAPGGWRLTGRWPNVSGVDHADWLLLAAPVSSGSGCGTRVFAVPRKACTVLDTWDPVGLRGTGSQTVALRPTFVPDSRSADLDAVLGSVPPDGTAHCHRLPAHAVGGMMFCASALGSARHALAVWRERTAGRPGLDEPFARSSAAIDAAAAVLHAIARRADSPHGPDDDLPWLAATGRRDASYAAELLTAAVEQLFMSGGSHAAAAGGELQCCWRDVHTVTGHGALAFPAAASVYASAAAAPPGPRDRTRDQWLPRNVDGN